MAVEPLSPATEMEAFYEQITARRLDALWRQQHRDPRMATVRAPYEPCRWRMAEVEAFMARATELVRPGPEAERRVLTLNNPSVTPIPTATHTISGAVQRVLPGEVAPSHRHTMAAIRWVLRGNGALTHVSGEGCSMNPGDLILTPSWAWHGHVNETSTPMLWMDSLDVPLVTSLRMRVFEPFPGEFQSSTVPQDHSRSRYGAGHLRPIWERGGAANSPLLSFPWAQTEEALHGLAQVDASPYDDVAMDYTNPATGGHVLPTIGCRIQMLRPNAHTRAHRHSTVSLYQAFRGRGSTIVDGVELEWEEGDMFSLPPWCWHEHRNASASEPAYLFSTNDLPLYEAIGLYLEHPYEDSDGHQTVTYHYAARYDRAALV